MIKEGRGRLELVKIIPFRKKIIVIIVVFFFATHVLYMHLFFIEFIFYYSGLV